MKCASITCSPTIRRRAQRKPASQPDLHPSCDSNPPTILARTCPRLLSLCCSEPASLRLCHRHCSCLPHCLLRFLCALNLLHVPCRQGYGYQGTVCKDGEQNIGAAKGAQNAAFTTSLSKYGEASYYGVARTVVHEVAHNLGAEHDCCTSGGCTGQGLVDGTDNPCPDYVKRFGSFPTVQGKTYSHRNDGCVPSNWETEGVCARARLHATHACLLTLHTGAPTL